MVWTNDNVLEFVELYRRERLLWDPKHLQHKNRREVSAAWMRIQSRMNIHLSIDDLKKKKESLMTSLRFHWNRKKNNPNYHTSWFAYEAMDAFLSGRYSCDNNINELENEFFNNSETYTQSQTNTDPISCRNNSTTEKNNTSIRQPRKSYVNKSNPRNLVEESPTYSKELKIDDQKLDEYDLYGQLLAKKLRKLEEHQRDVAMHDIDNIMFRAKMQGQTTQSRNYSASTSPVPTKIKSPIFIVTQQNHTQYENESIAYQNHGMPQSEPSS